MSVTYRAVLVWVFCLLTQGCSKLDDYMLGKDNTPKPTGLHSIRSKLTLVEDWSVPLGKPSKTSTYLKLKPAIRGNIIYVANANGMVQAVDKNTGRLVWSKQLRHGVVSGPTVALGHVAVGTNASHVVVLDQSDGQRQLDFKVSAEALSKPVLTHQKLMVKTIDGYLYGFDLKTGKKIWAYEHGTPGLMLKASSSPVIMGEQALVGFSDGKLDAIDLATGRLIWQRSIAYASGASDVERLVDIDADPIVRGDTVYIATYQGYIGAVSLSSGEFLWRKPASVYKNMAIDEHALYVTDSDDVVWGIDRQSGNIKWKQPALKARGLTEPVLWGHRLVVGDRTGLVHVMSTTTGELISRLQLSGPVDIAPVASGSSLYVMTAFAKLTRLSLASGHSN